MTSVSVINVSPQPLPATYHPLAAHPTFRCANPISSPSAFRPLRTQQLAYVRFIIEPNSFACAHFRGVLSCSWSWSWVERIRVMSQGKRSSRIEVEVARLWAKRECEDPHVSTPATACSEVTATHVCCASKMCADRGDMRPHTAHRAPKSSDWCPYRLPLSSLTYGRGCLM